MTMNMNEKIKNVEALNALKNQLLENAKTFTHTVRVCSGASCLSSGCGAVREALQNALEEVGIAGKTLVKVTGCIGNCSVGPAIVVEPEGVYYCKLKPEDAKTIVQKHLVGGQVAEALCYKDNDGKVIPLLQDIPYFKRQTKITMSNCGKIDFASLEDYIANDGYQALAKALTQMTPDAVVDEISKSGLKGRGGGGFPTGLKWKFASQNASDQKYVICNADEGDPGAFMDRTLLDGDAQSVIEGMLIAGYAIGASRGVVYLRAEYPMAVERLEKAIQKAQAVGLLGENILGTNFSFDIEIRIGAGAYVCGEETALMASVEGQRGEPRQKPPFPSDSGLYEKPTIINNVETLGSVPPIILKGADFYASYGTEKSKGTKVFALAGDVKNTGIVEVPIGTTAREMIFDIGGGIPNGKKLKVAQIGGPSGGVITTDYLDTPIDYEDMIKLGAIMGSGGLICMDEDTCMVDVARFFMEFVQDESCGKCVACRIGTRRMLEILERITQGEGKEGDLALLEELGAAVKDSALCGMGQATPNMVLSTLKYFREEYEEHIRDKYCRAGNCTACKGPKAMGGDAK